MIIVFDVLKIKKMLIKHNEMRVLIILNDDLNALSTFALYALVSESDVKIILWRWGIRILRWNNSLLYNEKAGNTNSMKMCLYFQTFR